MEKFTLENFKSLIDTTGIYLIRINDKEYIGSSVSIGYRLMFKL
jgi:hypothetical protein